MHKYIAASGHEMIARTQHEDKHGRMVWDYWTAAHSSTCPCLTSTDW